MSTYGVNLLLLRRLYTRAIYQSPQPTNRRTPLIAISLEPSGGLDSYFRLYMYMCVYVSRHHGHTVQVRDLYFWIYNPHIDEKNEVF